MTHNEKSTRYYSGRQERKVAKAVGGRQVANSGAPTFVAGDVITDQFLIEAKTKTTDCKSFTIKEDWLLKNEEEALQWAEIQLCALTSVQAQIRDTMLFLSGCLSY